MKRLLIVFMMLFAFVYTFSQVEGTWKVAPQAGALGVGPNQGDISWWSNSLADVTTRACFFDDTFVFNGDDSFNNVMGDETWLEPWQGVNPEACGTPIFPHDGSNAATWEYDAGAATLTVNGVGAYLGIPKVANGFELTDPSQAPESITYTVTAIDATSMTLDISIGGGWWRYLLAKELASGSDATLSDLQVDGETIDGFSPTQQNYTFGLPPGTTTVPQITTATPTDPDVTSVVITQATAIPGDATVVVTAADGTTTITYTVSYAIILPFTLPVTFDDDQVNYGVSDFGGNVSEIVVDPTDPGNMVVQSINGNETWAGTFLAGPNDTGLDEEIPFAPGSTFMRINIWSPAAGIPVRFKVENGLDGAIAVETDAFTTVASGWETLVFDFSNEVPDTPPINFDESYHKLVVFYNIGTAGTGEIYYWDDIKFGDVTAIETNNIKELTFVQNPVQDVLKLNVSEEITSINIFSMTGQTFMLENNSNNSYDISSLSNGVYTVMAIDKNGNKLIGKILKH